MTNQQIDGIGRVGVRAGSDTPSKPVSCEGSAPLLPDEQTLATRGSWWRERLAGAPPLTTLPGDHRRPSAQSVRRKSHEFTIDAVTTEALRSLAAAHDTTLTVVALSGLAVLLHRYTAQDDLVIGLSNAGRERPGTDLGGLEHTLPLRLDLSDGPRFIDVLREARIKSLEASEHGAMPFERLVQELGVEWKASHRPVVQVAISPHLPEQREVDELDVASRRPAFDLTLSCSETAAGMIGRFDYSSDLFESGTIERLAEQFVALLDVVAAAPYGEIRSLDIATAADKRLLSAWNQTLWPTPEANTFHELFAAQAARAPERIAVTEPSGQSITYGELDVRANRLAHHLRERGVCPEDLVAVCMDRSIDLIVALLGIFKAGGVYLPLDPTYPAARLQFMVADAAPRTLVTQAHLEHLVPQIANVVRVDADAEAIARAPASAPPNLTERWHLAYVIYTSGSTGQPKGAMTEHRNLVHLAEAQRIALGMTADARVLQFSPLSFDAGIWELATTLTVGATLCMLPPGRPPLGPELGRLIQSQRITFVTLIPSILPDVPVELLSSVKTLVVAGEACPAELVERFAAGRRFVNAYGPTECTVCATLAVCEPGGPPPIGRPLANVRVHVLDERRNLVPVGMVGELYIGGAGVGRGYLNRPDLTAERFPLDPFDPPGHLHPDPFEPPEAQARMYQTGDLVRWRSDGNLEFLGRTDAQVKVRGFRIELGEIEAAIRAHADVVDVAVVAPEDGTGNRRLVGYVAFRTSTSAVSEESLSTALRSELVARLPNYMVPAQIVAVKALPLAPSGKVDRAALAALSLKRASHAKQTPSSRSSTNTEKILSEIWSRVLDNEEVDTRTPFFEMGGNSLLLVRVQTEIAAKLDIHVGTATLFQFPTIESLARHLDELARRPERAEPAEQPASAKQEAPPALEDRVEAAPRVDEPVKRSAVAPSSMGEAAIAIIGRVGRFPGARNVDELWKLLVEGREGVVRFSDHELLEAGTAPELLTDPGFVPVGAPLEEATSFDAAFFGYAPEDATLMDPQLRLFLESAWEALEQAGYAPGTFAGRTGMFSGAGVPKYWLDSLASHFTAAAGPLAATFRTALGNPWQFLATATAYKLGLRGPALTLQTACSTSLVATHLACQSLLADECDIALAGGVSLFSVEKSGYTYEEGGIHSPDGHCRPFDAKGQGIVPGSGVAIVVLKRLQKALEDGDKIYAVIRGTAVNNDGSDKVGFTAPSVTGQREVIQRAQAVAGVRPDSITYVEAHGTATALGDPIEVEALRQVFGERPTGGQSCALGSIKANVGHLDTAAGVAGLIKACLALEHRYIPPTPNFESPNPKLELERTPFFVNTQGLDWKPRPGVPLRAGVSSFGIGGTNAHVVLEEAPVQAPVPDEAHDGPSLLIVSARSREALENSSRRLSTALREQPGLRLADVAHTLRKGRSAFDWRRAVVCDSVEGAVVSLKEAGPIRQAARDPEVAFLFPGMGTQHVGMGEALYRSEPRYREALDQCFDLFRKAGVEFKDAMFAPEERRAEADAALRTPSLNMASVFSTEYALAQLLGSWGIRPAAVIGHSLGEYTAACFAGVVSLYDAVPLVALRGRICDAMPPSGMLSVQLPERELLGEIGDELSIAAINGPRHCVVSGARGAVETLEAKLQRKGVKTKWLPVAGGMHSPLVEPAMQPLTDRALRMARGAPELPIVSNVTATWLSENDALDPAYWARHLRQPVRFYEGLETLLQKPERILLEVGPGKTLATLASLHPKIGEERVVLGALASLGREQNVGDERAALLHAVGQLWASGVQVDWDQFRENRTLRTVSLPTYPFERKRHARTAAPTRLASSNGGPTATTTSSSDDVVRAVQPNVSRRDIPSAVEQVWKELLGVDRVEPQSNFFELGGTSLLAIQVNGQLKERLGVKLTAHALLEHPTLSTFSRAVANAYGTRRTYEGKSALLLRLQEGRSGETPLVLIQPIGGTVYSYLPLTRHLGRQRPIYAFRASGLEDGEVVYRDIPAMAERYVDELLEVQPEGPYLLGGHSSGGVVAYEMAHILWRRGFAVRGLFQIDSVSVEQSRRAPIRTVNDVERLVEAFAGIAPETRSILAGIRADRRLEDVVLATNEALSRYEPVSHPVPLTYVRAAERDSYLDHRADAWWAEMTRGSFDVHTVPGNHFTIMDPPYVAEVARLMNLHLEPSRAYQANGLEAE